jgi:hypothetical protein
MKKRLVYVLLLLFIFTTIIDAQRRRRSRRARRAINITCPTNLGGITNCPDKGCGTNLDPLLNQRKNLTFDPLNQPVKKRTVAWLKNREDPIVWFKGKDRTELIGFGEGQHIKVVAFLIKIKPGSGESCNCKLTGVANTDNHLVLVEKADLAFTTFHRRERESVTAEFTPRVRINGHPNWKETKYNRS